MKCWVSGPVFHYLEIFTRTVSQYRCQQDCHNLQKCGQHLSKVHSTSILQMSNHGPSWNKIMASKIISANKGFKRSHDGISSKPSLQIRSMKTNQKSEGVEKQEAENEGAEKVTEQ